MRYTLLAKIPLRRPVAWALDRLVAGYQRWISPLTPPSCRYHPSCSAYAREALAVHNVWRAMGLTIWRILRCQPFSAGGFDPVPLPPGMDRSSVDHRSSADRPSTCSHGHDHPDEHDPAVRDEAVHDADPDLERHALRFGLAAP